MTEDMNHEREYVMYCESIERAKRAGSITFYSDDFDEYSHMDSSNTMLFPTQPNTRCLGHIGRLILSTTRHTKSTLNMLFLGAGAGRECLDAKNMMKKRDMSASIHTVTLTPIAPDIAPCEDRIHFQQTDTYIDRQYIGNYVHMPLPPERKYDFIYDQYGPLYHCGLPDRSHTEKRENYEKMIKRTLEHASPGAYVVQEEFESLADIGLQEIWEEQLEEDDVLLRSNDSCVLLRGVHSLVPSMSPKNNFDFDHSSLEVTLQMILSALPEKRHA